MGALRPEHVMRILEITDSLNISRESVTIPLVTEEKGSVTILSDGRLHIICPGNADFEEWMKELRHRLGNMDLAKLWKH